MPSAARLRVVTRATALFVERGYDSVSMRDLGKDLGMQAPSLYSHFPSKHALLEAVVAPLIDGMTAVIDKAPNPATTVRRRIWLAEFVEWVAANGQLLAFTVNDRSVLRQPSLRPRIFELHHRLDEVVQNCFEIKTPEATRSIVGFLCWPFMAPWGEPFDEDARAALIDQTEALIEFSRR